MKLRRAGGFELVLVAYDTPDDKRRRKMAETLEGFGDRLQWSVFECWILPGDLPRLIRTLRTIAHEFQDRLAIIPINRAAMSATTHMGSSSWQEPPPFRLIGDFEPAKGDARADKN
jgi:CRISPR-associated protein Cas2